MPTSWPHTAGDGKDVTAEAERGASEKSKRSPITNTETDNQPLLTKQKRVAYLFSLFLIILVVVSDAVMAGTLWKIASRIRHRAHPLIPPAPELLFVFYILVVASLAGCVLWVRSRVASIGSLPPPEFVRQTQIGLTISSLGFYLGPVWVFLGGAWAQSTPLLVGQAVVSLLCVLPVVLRYGMSIR